MSSATDLVVGIITRAIEFVIKDVAPSAASLLPGPFGALLKAALGTQYAADLETKIGAEVGSWTGNEISALEAECQKWADEFMSTHPEAKKFFAAVKPAAPIDLGIFLDDELKALLASKLDGTLRGKLGLVP